LNGSPRDRSDVITEQHLVLVYTIASLRLPRDQAEDVAQDALERAIRGLRKMSAPPANVEAWLTTLTRRAVADFWKAWERRNGHDAELATWAATLPSEPDPARKITPAVGVGQFVRGAAELLAPRDNDALPLYLLVVNKYMSRATMAEMLDIEPVNFSEFLIRWRRRFAEAMLVLAYLTDLGVDERCDFLVTARQRPLSPLLRKDVARHIERCPRCGDHRRTLSARIAGLASSAPIVLPPPGLLERALRAHGAAVRHKATLAAAVVAATACFVVTGMFADPVHDRAVAVGRPSSMTAAPPSVTTPVTTPQPVTSDVTTPVEPTPSVHHHIPAPPRPAATTPHASPRRVASGGLTITVPANAIGSRSIATTRGSGCGLPFTTGFTVTVTARDGVADVAARLDTGESAQNEIMNNTAGTSTWTGSAGPYESTKDGHTVRIVVVAVSRDGEMATAFVGTVRLVTCH
jgi:DNA-directed RNA polymerase specialized sigma24 family protein